MASPFPFSAGQVLTAAELNSIGEATTYSPSHTNITVGNGTEIARYVQVNKLCLVSYKLTFGSTSSFAGTVSVGLPLTANADAFASGIMTDTGTSNYQMLASVTSGQTAATIRAYNITGSYARGDSFANATTPFTWTTGDILSFSLVYEVQ